MVVASERGGAWGWRWPLALGLSTLSGFAGLGYQIVWTQQSALWLGHEAPAVLAVITAFFAGLSLGALWLSARIERSARPGRWYSACEATLGLWALLAGALLPRGSDMLVALIGAQPAPLLQWSMSFAGVLLLLLPATTAMGATLPAMQRALALHLPAAAIVAPLYAANTAGAVLGVLAVSFWSIPHWGLARSLWICAALSLCCALIWMLATPAPAASARVHPPAARGAPAAPPWPWRLAVTGLLGIGFEVLVVRVLSQLAEDTVYTFALLLTVYLLGTAGGAAFYRRLDARRPDQLGDRLFAALAAACLAGTASLWFAADLQRWLIGALGQRMAAAILVEAALAVIAFAPATFVMGAVFSHLAQQAVRGGRSFGLALGVNTLGCAAAPCLFGLLALPALGPKRALLLVALAYLALGTRRLWRSPTAWATVAVSLLVALFAPPLAFVDVPFGGRVLHYEDGVMAAVSVVEDADGVARLRIDNRQQEGSSATRRVDSRQAFLPLLLHPAPRDALFLGLGTGITSDAATLDPQLHVDVVELLPEVLRASRLFVQPSPRRQIITADARRYVRTAGRRYDLIVADNFHPARAGTGSLYTVEHFGAVRRRLQPDGVFCQWLPLHQLDLATLRSIVRSFLAVYPHGWALLASNSLQTPVVGLIARADDGLFDAAALAARVRTAAAPLGLNEVGIEDPLALFGNFIAGPSSLAGLASGAALNTDDRPVVAYRAPRITYEPDSEPRDRLIELLAEVSIEPAELLGGAAGELAPERLSAYWSARDRFIVAGRDVPPSRDAAALLAQVRAPLLAVLSLSPDFRPAYQPLLRLAVAIAATDRPAARELLIELTRLQPSWPEAALALQRLDTAQP